MKTAGGNHGAARLVVGAAVAGLLAIGAVASPASAASSGWEAILGGHIRSGTTANRIAAAAKHDGFRVHVQRISATNWEAEIFNGGRTKSQAEAVCAKARKFNNLPHCSVEQEFHGNGWG
ncbi:MAG TPA: hypothetical protein VJ622_05935 [Acidimicrobiia bacterium]|nr:hypothetical protein [Acidimicrobiia bacterium]HKN89801.1 hypothetical protein [Acidimicrobiia bacterium]